MRRSVCMFVLAFTVLAGGAFAQSAGDRGNGIGIVIGEPTGLSFKHWLDARSALDLAAAWSLDAEDRFELHGDYLYHDFHIVPNQDANLELPLYYGIGARLNFRANEDSEFGVRIPVGLDFIFAKTPLDLFVELAPILDLTPSTEFDLAGGIGGRFFF